MACARCKQKRAAMQQAVVSQSPITHTYLKKRYVGEDGEVKSVLPNTTYGQHVNGDIMTITKVDYEANPTWWEDV